MEQIMKLYRNFFQNYLDEGMYFRRISILLIWVSQVLLICSLFSVIYSPALGYEYSIYSSTPLIFWISIIFGLLAGMAVIIISVVKHTKGAWLLGLYNIVLCLFLAISAYAIRGYIVYLARGDTLCYVGMASYVSASGHFHELNQYPFVAILVSAINQVSHVSIISISQYLPAFYYLLFIFSIYCLAKSIDGNRKYILLSLVSATPIFFAWFSTSIYPMQLATLSLPLFYYCLIKCEKIQYKILATILTIAFVLFHPINAIYIMFSLIILYILCRIYLPRESSLSKKLILFFGILSISYLVWLLHQWYLMNGIEIIVDRLITTVLDSSGSTQGVLTTDEIAKNYASQIGYSGAFRYIFFNHFDEVLYALLVLILGFTLFNEIRRRRLKTLQDLPRSQIVILFLVVLFFVGNIFLGLLAFGTYIHGPLRLLNLNFNYFLAPVLAGYLIYHYLGRSRFACTCVLVLVAISVITSLFSLYPSPLVLRPNDQFSSHDISGMDWLVTFKDIDVYTKEINTPVDPYAQYKLGDDEYYNRRDIKRSSISAHFNIDDDCTLVTDDDCYLSISEFDVSAYTILWKNIGKYDSNDIIRLTSSSNVFEIFDNNQYRVYYVSKKGIL